jgi:thiol peroxidase
MLYRRESRDGARRESPARREGRPRLQETFKEIAMSCCDCGAENTGVITFQGNPMTLLGTIRKVGDEAPDFTVIKNDLTPGGLSDYRGRKVLIASVPSLDTGVCDLETKRFNKEASSVPGVQIITVSMDLPFAQARWCGAAGVNNLLTMSDYMEADFGLKYGLLIKELRLLTRAVVVVDESGKIAYQEIVPEVTNQPDYEAALRAVK